MKVKTLWETIQNNQEIGFLGLSFPLIGKKYELTHNPTFKELENKKIEFITTKKTQILIIKIEE